VTCGRLKPLPRLAVGIPDIRHKISTDRRFLFSFHSSNEERASVVGYDDVALGGRQISRHVGETCRRKEPLGAAFRWKASVPAADLHRIDPLVARSRHADLVESAVAESTVPTDSEIVLSWRRCMGDYHVDPRSRATP